MATYEQNYQNAVAGMSGRADLYNDRLANWRADVDATKRGNIASINAVKSEEQMKELVGGAQDIGLIATAEGAKKAYSKYIFKQGQQPFGNLDKEEHGGYDFEKSKTLGKKYWKKKEGSSANAEEGGEGDTGVLDDIANSDLVPNSVRSVAKGASKTINRFGQDTTKAVDTDSAGNTVRYGDDGNLKLFNKGGDDITADPVGDALSDLMTSKGVVPVHTPDVRGGGGGGEVEMTGKSLKKGPFVDDGTGTGLNLEARKAQYDAANTDETFTRSTGPMADYSTGYTPPEPTMARLPAKTGGGPNMSGDALENSHGGVITQPRATEGGGESAEAVETAESGKGGIFSLTEVPDQTATTVAGDVVKTATGGADEAVGEGLDVAGAALEATGIFAWLGALLQVGATATEAYGAYSLGKGIYDEATGKDDGKDAPQEALPNKPIPSAPMSIISNTALSQPSFSGSW